MMIIFVADDVVENDFSSAVDLMLITFIIKVLHLLLSVEVEGLLAYKAVIKAWNEFENCLYLFKYD